MRAGAGMTVTLPRGDNGLFVMPARFQRASSVFYFVYGKITLDPG